MRRAWFMLALGSSSVAIAADRDDDDENEVEIKLAELPAVVKQAVLARWPGAKLLEADKIDDGASYDVEFKTTARQKLEVNVSAAGVIGALEDDDDDDDDDDR